MKRKQHRVELNNGKVATFEVAKASTNGIPKSVKESNLGVKSAIIDDKSMLRFFTEGDDKLIIYFNKARVTALLKEGRVEFIMNEVRK